MVSNTTFIFLRKQGVSAIATKKLLLSMQVQQANNGLINHSDPQPLLRNKHCCPNGQVGLVPSNITRSTEKLAKDQGAELIPEGLSKGSS